MPRAAQTELGGSSASAAGTQPLLRGLRVLECVAAGIVATPGTSRSTTHRILSSLVTARYPHHMPRKGYLPAPVPIRLGRAARWSSAR